MIQNRYDFNEEAQMKLLAMFIREPEDVQGIVEPRYFTNSIHMDIARWAKEIYKGKDPKTNRLEKSSLRAFVWTYLKEERRKNAREFKKPYMGVIREIFEESLGDRAVMLDLAVQFAKDGRFREALVEAEKDVNNRKYGRACERFEKLRPLLNGTGAETSVRALRDSLRQQMDKPPKEVEWDVPGFFPARATILFAGRKGEGKSYLLQAMGKASREGSELVKRLPVMKKRFLYLVREGVQELYDQRFRELEFDYRKQSSKFQLWGPWMEPIPPKILETGTPYREWAKEFAPCSIAIDGLRRFFDGDENSSEVMDPVGQELTAWANNGATVYIAHHRGKSRIIDSRGSSAIEDFVSVQYVVEALREGQRISKIQVRCVKNWYGEEKALLLKPHWDDGKFWFTGGEDTKAEDQWARDKEKVLSHTSVTEWVPRETIFDALVGKIGRDRIIEILNSESGQNGKLRAKRGSKPGAPFMYRRLRKAEAESSSDSGEDE